MLDKDSINKVILIGNLGQDPETKQAKSGTQVVTFGLATKTQQKDADPQTEWHNLVAFGNTGSVIANYASKGDKVYAEGRLQTNTYTDSQGVERKSTKILVNQFQRLNSTKNSPAQQNQGGGSDLPF